MPKTRGKVSIKVQRKSARWSLPLNICLVKLATGVTPMKMTIKRGNLALFTNSKARTLVQLIFNRIGN